jgi:hypothetical protein
MKTLVLALFAAAAAVAQQPEPQRAAERIQQAQYIAAIERRAQHREIERVQPVSRLEPGVAATQRKAQLDRLVMPGRTGAER